MGVQDLNEALNRASQATMMPFNAKRFIGEGYESLSLSPYTCTEWMSTWPSHCPKQHSSMS